MAPGVEVTKGEEVDAGEVVEDGVIIGVTVVGGVVLDGEGVGLVDGFDKSAKAVAATTTTITIAAIISAILGMTIYSLPVFWF